MSPGIVGVSVWVFSVLVDMYGDALLFRNNEWTKFCAPLCVYMFSFVMLRELINQIYPKKATKQKQKPKIFTTDFDPYCTFVRPDVRELREEVRELRM